MEIEKIEKLWQELKTERDELRVQMNLAKAELRDEWEDLEAQYVHAQRKFDEFRKDGGELAGEAKQALNIVVDEIGAAYKRVKQRLKQH